MIERKVIFCCDCVRQLAYHSDLRVCQRDSKLIDAIDLADCEVDSDIVARRHTLCVVPITHRCRSAWTLFVIALAQKLVDQGEINRDAMTRRGDA